MAAAVANVPSPGGGFMLVSMYTSRVSCQTNAVKLPPVFNSTSHLSNFNFLAQSQGVGIFCFAVSYRMRLFSLSLSHLKVLAMKKLSINSLLSMRSTQRIKYLTLACVVVMFLVAECESLPKYTRVSYV